MGTKTVLHLVILTALVLCAVPLHAETDADTTYIYPEHRRDRNPVEYVLALPSIALKLPFKLMAGLVSGPVILMEKQSFLPTIQEWLSIVDVSGVYPVVGLGSTTGLVGGVEICQRDLFGRGVGTCIRGTYSTNSYRFGSIQVGGRHWGNGRFGLIGELGWRADTRERFFGIGSSSRKADQSNYGFRGAFGSAKLFWQVDPRLDATAFASFRRVEPRDGRRISTEGNRDLIAARFADQDLYGLFETLDLYEFGAEWRLDWRDRPGSPLRGGTEFLHISYVTGEGAADTNVGFWRIRGEATHNLNLFRGRVISVRVLAEVTEPDDGTRIPFYELARLGGSRSLRGYSTDRFSGRDMALLTVEYRWPLWRRLDAFLFTDHGRVFDNIENDFAFSNFRSSYGGGLRLWQQSGSAELLIADGSEAIKIYLNVDGLL